MKALIEARPNISAARLFAYATGAFVLIFVWDIASGVFFDRYVAGSELAKYNVIFWIGYYFLPATIAGFLGIAFFSRHEPNRDDALLVVILVSLFGPIAALFPVFQFWCFAAGKCI